MAIGEYYLQFHFPFSFYRPLFYYGIELHPHIKANIETMHSFQLRRSCDVFVSCTFFYDRFIRLPLLFLTADIIKPYLYSVLCIHEYDYIIPIQFGVLSRSKWSFYGFIPFYLLLFYLFLVIVRKHETSCGRFIIYSVVVWMWDTTSELITLYDLISVDPNVNRL